MLKYFIVLSLLISPACFSQKKFDPDKEHENFFRGGAKGGLNINKLKGQSYKSVFSYNFQAGVFLQFNFSAIFGVQPEVNFVQASAEPSNDANDIYDDLFFGGSQSRITLNYLEVPVFLNVNVGPSKRVKLQVGPSFGGLIKQKADSLKPNIELYKKNEWSIIGGLWLQLPVINIGARYKLGLTNINNIDHRETWKNQAIQLFIGFTI